MSEFRRIFSFSMDYRSLNSLIIQHKVISALRQGLGEKYYLTLTRYPKTKICLISSLRGYGGEPTQFITIQPKCDDSVSLGQMLLYTLGAEYEHRRKIARNYLTFAFEESEIRIRNCRYNGSPLTCTGCSRISSGVTDFDHKGNIKFQ
jgi:hypothetical protein